MRNILLPNDINFIVSEVVVNRLLGICDAVCRCFQNVHSVNAEAAVLSRIIYRMKLKFRNDKGFKALQKVLMCFIAEHYL